MVENATIQWEIFLARHMILSWPLSFLFQPWPANNDKLCMQKIVESVSKNNVCAAFFEKNGKNASQDLFYRTPTVFLIWPGRET